MRGEMPHNLDFGGMPGREKEFPCETPAGKLGKPMLPKDAEVNLSLDKKMPEVANAEKRDSFVEARNEGNKSSNLKEMSNNPEVRRIEINARTRQELVKIPKDTVENFDTVAEKIIANISDSYVLEEVEKETIRLKVEIHFHILNDIKRLGLLNEEEKGKKLRELAIKDAVVMQKVGNRVKSISENDSMTEEEKEKRVDNIWRGVKEIYNDHADFYRKLNNEHPEYNIGGDGFEGIKRGILGQVAAERLFELANEYLKKSNAGEITIKSSTAEEDVDKKIDFFIKVKYKNGAERIIPCQIKAPEFNIKTKEMIKSSIIDVVSKGKYFEHEGVLTAKQRKMIKFQKSALEEYGIGLFITIPEGKAIEAVKSQRSKKGKINKKVIDLVGDDGSVADDTKKRFFMEIGNALSLDILNDRNIIERLSFMEEDKNKNKKGGKKK